MASVCRNVNDADKPWHVARISSLSAWGLYSVSALPGSLCNKQNLNNSERRFTQHLPLRLEAGDHRLGVHAELDDFQRDSPPYWLGLLGDIDHTTAALADLLQQLVAANRLANGVVSGCIGRFHFDRRPGGVRL